MLDQDVVSLIWIASSRVAGHFDKTNREAEGAMNKPGPYIEKFCPQFNEALHLVAIVNDGD